MARTAPATSSAARSSPRSLGWKLSPTSASKRRPFSIGSTRVCAPRDGVIEAVVVVHGRARTRAVALRLEGLDRRWRATAINVL